MPQNTPNRKGYVAFSAQVTTTKALITDLYNALYPNDPLIGNWREVQIQVDPEVSSGAQLRIGSGSVGSTVGGVVQKGNTLDGGSAQDTYRCSSQNAIPVNMIYLQGVSGNVTVNIQLFPI